jgi:HTH-type transcriptional regulator/antitoxin HipB
MVNARESSSSTWRSSNHDQERTAVQDHPQPQRRGTQHHRRAAALADALRGTLGDLEAELAEYDALHDATLIEATGIEQLPTALIRARIACGLTQRQLAERVGLQEQAIQRYEATDYAGVSFARLVEIAEALELTIHYDVRLTEAS